MVTPDVRPLKNRLREESKQIRRNFSFEEKKKKDAAIFWRLTGLPQYQHCRMLLTFVSTPIEVDTRRIIQQALRDQKQVVVPRCIPDQIQMEFCRIHSLRDLKKGTFSVMEPKTYCKVIRCFRNSICIVPGLAFDMYGYRLGYGKGYYDRFLKHYQGFRVGICYTDCLKNQLPHGKYDQAVHLLATDKFSKTFLPYHRK